LEEVDEKRELRDKHEKGKAHSAKRIKLEKKSRTRGRRGEALE
jgi:hypothetical protein